MHCLICGKLQAVLDVCNDCLKKEVGNGQE